MPLNISWRHRRVVVGTVCEGGGTDAEDSSCEFVFKGQRCGATKDAFVYTTQAFQSFPLSFIYFAKKKNNNKISVIVSQT